MLQHGQSTIRHELPFPIDSCLPGVESLTQLGCAIETLGAGILHERQTVEITLSDALTRCWILERLPGLASPREIDGLAYDQMQQIYGDTAADAAQWVVQVDAAPFANRWPAIALARALLDLLCAIAETQGWHLGKIQTRFVRGFNACSSQSIRQPAQAIYWLESSDGLTIGIRNAREWQALRTHPPLTLLGSDLQAMLRRDCRAIGLQIANCQVQPLHWPVKRQGR